MAVLRWAFVGAALTCIAIGVVSGVANGIALLAVAFAVLAVTGPTLVRLVWVAFVDLLQPTCLDCRDGRHLACEGCDCPVDHDIERLIADVESRTNSL